MCRLEVGKKLKTISTIFEWPSKGCTANSLKSEPSLFSITCLKIVATVVYLLTWLTVSYNIIVKSPNIIVFKTSLLCTSIGEALQPNFQTAQTSLNSSGINPTPRKLALCQPPQFLSKYLGKPWKTLWNVKSDVQKKPTLNKLSAVNGRSVAEGGENGGD